MAQLVGDRESETAKRRIVTAGGMLGGIENDQAFSREQKARRLAKIPPLLDPEAEKVFRDRLDGNGDLGAAERLNIPGPNGVRAGVCVLACQVRAGRL
jgi:hypothetical protein